MKKLLPTLLLLLTAVYGRAAQADVTFRFAGQTADSDYMVDVTKDGVRFEYQLANGGNSGAYVYGLLSLDMYKLKISSTNGKKIAWVELDGCAPIGSQKGTDMAEELTAGTWTHVAGGTSVWHGASTSLRFACDRSSIYTVQKARVWFEGSDYEPGAGEDLGDGDTGGGTIIDRTLVGQPLVRTAVTPVDGQPVRMAIISTGQFKEQVEKYALWKTQQGYQVEEIYAEDYSQQGTLKGDAWAQAIRERLIETRPAFVLIMGDDIHVPAFDGTFAYKSTTGDTDYVTDYYYGEYEGGDFWPEAYVGRFSAYDAEELENQMNKTEHMSLLSAADGSWLSNSLCLVAPDGKDNTIVAGDKYAQEYLSKLGCTVTTSGPSNPDKINSTINSGCGVVTYFGHGGEGDLNGQYNRSHAESLKNAGRYPIMLALTCLTGTFDGSPWKSVVCLAEKLQRMKDAGTVCYVGATRESYADKQFLTGGTKEGQTYLGFMRSMFPIDEENKLNQQSRTIGEAVAIGRYSISCYIEKYMQWGTEYHELFGDPTYQPYYTTPLTMTVSAPATIEAGRTLCVTAVPNAVVCLSRGRSIVGVTMTDERGRAFVQLSEDTPVATDYTLYCSAPNYTDYRTQLAVTAYEGEVGEPVDTDFDFEDYTRHRVLVDKFTGQQCPWCSSDDRILTGYLNSKDLHDDIYELRHYSYTPDRFSLNWHTTLKDKWDVSGHPSYLVDRAGYNGQKYVNGEGYNTRAESIRDLDWITTRKNAPCRLSLTLDGTTFDPVTRVLKVVVSGKAQTQLPDLCINLFIAQNGIEAYQSGEGSNYVHNGISRDYLTKTVFGDKLGEREDGVFQVEYLYQLPDKIGYYELDPKSVDIVAFVTSWDDYRYSSNPKDKDFSNSEVHNTTVRCLADLPLAAIAPSVDKENPTSVTQTQRTDAPAPIYNLQGQQIRQLQRGVNIVGGRKVLR